MPIRPFAPLPSPAVERQRDHDRRHPERETIELAATAAATPGVACFFTFIARFTVRSPTLSA